MSSRWATIFSPSSPALGDALPTPPPGRAEAAWTEWSVRHNRRALVVAAVLVLTFHPLFLGLDRYVVPAEAQGLVLGVRLLSWSLALAAMLLRHTEFFTRHATGVTGAMIVSAGFSICVMTRYFHGLRSPYSNGLMLVMFGAGLVFLWPLRVALLVHGLIVAGFLAVNTPDLFGGWDSALAIPVAFVTSTAVVVATGQQ